MTLKVTQIPVLSDNYAYILQCLDTQQIALVDVPDGSFLVEFLKNKGLKPTMILNTHHHWDHADDNPLILNEFDCEVYASVYDQNRIPGVTKLVKQGDSVTLGQVEFQVLDVVGHTLGHIAYYTPGFLFSGDTVFVGGCGRLFEGTAEQMFESLQKIKALPANTKIYGAHEYTLKNLEFALSVDGENKDLQKKYQQAQKLRQQGLPTVPTTIAEELTYNPFLRAKTVAEFARLRKVKDSF